MINPSVRVSTMDLEDIPGSHRAWPQDHPDFRGSPSRRKAWTQAQIVYSGPPRAQLTIARLYNSSMGAKYRRTLAVSQ